MLRKLSLLTIICALAIGFCACSNDDDEPSSSLTYIIGKWQGVSSTGWEKEDGKVVDKWQDDEPDFDYIEFNMDATGKWRNESGSSHSFTWYINDDAELVIGEKIVGDGTGDVYKIKKVNKNTLILVYEENDPDSDSSWYQEDTYKRID